MRKKLIILFLLLVATESLWAETRIGHITGVRGIDENLLQGYGLVVGLNGKGDKGAAIKKVARKILKRLGSEFDVKELEARNMAIVHVTAILPAFSRPGQKVDVTVAAQGAESLEGGILFACNLYLSGTDPANPENRPIVLAQGPILVGNTGTVGRQSTAAGSGASIPTVGKAVGGGVVLPWIDEVVEQNYIKIVSDRNGKPVQKWIELVLDRPNFTNASEIAKEINKKFSIELINPDENQEEIELAIPISAGEVVVSVPEKRWNNIIEFIAIIERIPLNHFESEAVVVVNEKTNGIAMSGDVKLNACTISYNEVNITITKDQDLAQVLQQLSTVLRTKDQIEIIKTIHSAGHLRARLLVE